VQSVADAVRAAHVVVPYGRLLSVVSHRVLDAHAAPARVEVNGAAATMGDPVRPGDVVILLHGVDRIESTRTRILPLRLDAAAANLYVTSESGQQRVVEGAISGEQVSSSITRAPAVGKLRAPARLAFTFDDGPNGSATAAVLRLLAAHHTPAVFCLIGQNAVAQPHLAAQEAAAGYRMCDHTQTHPLDLPDLTRAQIAAEMSGGYQSITRTDGGVAPVYFRAPGGNWSQTIIDDARALHLIPLRWTVDPRDWSVPGTQTIVTRVLDQLRPDGVILMHDGGGDRSQTVAALELLLDELARAGWVAGYPT
jgi:peptidoglycan/xylan/chitin deacetylase (PgdA/CDA1 family)